MSLPITRCLRCNHLTLRFLPTVHVNQEARRRKAEVWNVAFGAGAIQSRAAGTQEGFRRCRTHGEAAGGPGIGSEFCARCRTTVWSCYWKRLTHRKYQLTRDRVRLNIKLSSLVSDLI